MAEIQFNVNMDLVDKYTPAEDITIPQEDNLSVKFTYSIFNREVAEDLTGATDIVVSFVKPDGHIVLQSDGTLVLPNKVNIVANAQAFAYVGKVYMQVQYKKGATTFNTRQAFFWVERSNTSCQTVASSDYAPYLDNIKETWTLLSALDLQALIDSKQTAENAQADVDALTPRVTTLETNYTALASRVTAVETKNTQQDSRLTSLETQQGTFATNISNLQSSDTAQNTRLTNLESGQTTQDNRLTAIESKNTSQDTKISALETSAADIPTMKTDITAIKGANTTQDNRLSTLETAKTANDTKNATQDTNIGNNATAISGLQTSQAAQDTKITNLESYQTSSNTRITAVETKNTTQDSRLLALEQTQPDLAPINSRLTDVETKNTAQDAGITALETAKTANDTKNTQQDSRLTALENGASSLSSTVASNKTAQDTVNTNTNNSLTTLTTRVTATETKNATQDTRLDAAESKNTSQDTKIATLEGAISVIVSDIDALESSVGGHEVRLDDNDTKNSAQDSLIVSNTSAISSLTTTVNNNQTGMNTRVTALETAKTANDTKNAQQDNRLTALENYDTTQDTRMTTIEGVNTAQNNRLTPLETDNTSNKSRLTTLETDNTSNKSRLTTAETNITNLTNNKLNKSEAFYDYAQPNGNTQAIVGQDLNTIQKTGLYGGNNLGNAPKAGYWYVEVIRYSDVKYVKQTATLLTSGATTEVWVRRMNNDVWESWGRLAHDSEVVKKAGDTMTGDLNLDRAGATTKKIAFSRDGTEAFNLYLFSNTHFGIRDSVLGQNIWEYNKNNNEFVVLSNTNLMKKADYTAKDGRASLTLTADATNADTGNPPSVIRRGNTVTVRFKISRNAGSSSSRVTTLPVDMRPIEYTEFNTISDSGSLVKITIGTGGGVDMYSTGQIVAFVATFVVD